MRLSLKRKNEYTKQSQKAAEVNIMRLMLPSILGMLLCAVCLAGTTWAWFTATSSINNDLSIKAAEFKVDVSFDIDEGVAKNGSTYQITSNKEYTVKIESTGTTSGYCIVAVDGTRYYTSMNKNDAKTFIVCSSRGELTVTTTWNSKLVEDMQQLSSSGKIGNGTVENNSQDTNDNKTEEHSNKVPSKPKESDDNKPEQGNDTPAQVDEPKETPTEPENSSETGE